MIGESWFYGAMLAIVGLQLATLVVAYWRGEGPFEPAEAVDDRQQTQGEAVVCPDCGTENALDYRFCRRCVTELPGRYHAVDSPTPPLGRGSR